jgi:ribonucleotide reductase beta subunit family protein with ferritin-like domain
MFGSKNPFPFMELISVGNQKGNFFEVNISSYSKANVGKSEQDMVLSFGDDD